MQPAPLAMTHPALEEQPMTATAPPPRAGLPPAAHGTLLESRQRWRDFAALSADFAFETDTEGRITFAMPEAVLGWPSSALLGHPANWLLLQPEPDPFALTHEVRDLRTWLRRADGEAACLSFNVAPLATLEGGFAGLRGTARDVTAEMREIEAQASALRRALAVQALVRRVREAALAPRMLPALMRLLPAVIGCVGAAVIAYDADGQIRVTHREDGDPSGLLACLPRLEGARPIFAEGPEGERLALVAQPVGKDTQALLVWREPGAPPFDEDERHLLSVLSDLLAVVLGNHVLLRELERQARTEPLTGLLNRRSFLEELGRRLGSPRRGGRGGVLLFLDLDNLKPINDRLGHDAGDAALVALAGLLARSFRPCDLAARCGGDEFAVWLDGAGEGVGTARAAALCQEIARLQEVPARLSVSIGCAVVPPGVPETPEALLARADAAMYAAKHAGGNGWRLAAPIRDGGEADRA
jgi:diguanylate cyclase (GGDEF)-like protein/PAS domain S-box-containing protein